MIHYHWSALLSLSVFVLMACGEMNEVPKAVSWGESKMWCRNGKKRHHLLDLFFFQIEFWIYIVLYCIASCIFIMTLVSVDCHWSRNVSVLLTGWETASPVDHWDALMTQGHIIHRSTRRSWTESNDFIFTSEASLVSGLPLALWVQID